MGGSRARGLIAAGMLAGACVFAPRPGAADSTAVALPAWLEEVTLNGFLSASYSYNFNRPSSGMNQLRVFDFDDNTFKLDVFELVLQKPVAKPRDSGFRVDLTMGSSIPRVAAAAGLFRDPSGVAQDFDLQQGFASYVAPLGSGLRVDFGKFITHFGYEVIEGYDGWNDNATRSILFGYAIPFTHLGVRASYTLSPRAAVMGMVVNGWDVARDNNKSKSVGGQLVLTPTPPLAIYLNGMWGPERDGDDRHARALFDLLATLKGANGRTFGLNGDWASEDFTDESTPGIGPPVKHWMGIAAYARNQLGKSRAVSFRMEWFNDRDGLRTGTAQELWESTVTPEWRLTPQLLVRADLRWDHSDASVFLTDSAPRVNQTTVLLNAIYSF